MKEDILKLAYSNIGAKEELEKEAVFSFFSKFGGKHIAQKVTKAAKKGTKVKGVKPPKSATKPNKTKKKPTFAGRVNKALFGPVGSPAVSLAGKGLKAVGRRLPGAIGTAGTGVYNTAKVAFSGGPKGTAFWMGTGAAGSGFSSKAWENGVKK